MPDFTFNVYAFCLKSRNFHRQVTGSKGNRYIVSFCFQPAGKVQYDWQCTCKGFFYRGSCRHIEETKALPIEEGGLCGWHEFTDEDLPIKDEYGDYKCPRCGGHVDFENVGV